MPGKSGIRVEVAEGAVERFLDYCRKEGRKALHVVGDRNTMEALGARLASTARVAGFDLTGTAFGAASLTADADSVFRLLLDLDGRRDRLLVAVGSGTITDIVRFVAHRAALDFVSLPTAPSVDAYSSVVAPLVVEEAKRTVKAKAPLAVFADPAILARAPRPMVAAGFGDMICKFSAIADWRLGALLWGESFDEGIAERAIAAARSCVEVAEGIGRAETGAIRVLIAALIESGRCMADAGHSRPASGAEHQYSHFWEMRLLRESRPPILHGLKVGVATVLTAELWDRVKATPAVEARRLLDAARLPDRALEVRKIEAAYGPGAEEWIALQSRFLDMRAEELRNLGDRIGREWERIRDIAHSVPSAAETRSLLEKALCPTSAATLGLGPEEIELALSSAHYLRDRFTVRKLWKLIEGR